MKKLFYRLLAIALVVAAGYGAWRLFSSLQVRQKPTPTTRVRQGDVVVRSFTRGELRAVRVASLAAPNLFGTVQVTRLAPLGSFAREKDLIVEFDDSEVLSRLEQRELELEQSNEQIKKSQADLAIRNNQDQVDLLRARYAVRRAELEVKRNELLPAIDQRKNLLNLEEARRRLKQLEVDIKSRREQAEAELAVLRERRRRTELDINREKARLSQVKLLAPISGLVAIKQNRSGFSGMFGTAIPDIREGDQVQPGMPVAEVLDLSELEVIARVGELDRANLTEGQDVLIRLDAIPDKVFNGKIKSLSGTASANVFSSDPGKKFDVLFSIDMRQLLTALGAKEEQIARILATAEENRKKPIAQPMTSMFAMSGLSPDAIGAMTGGMGGAIQGAPAVPGAMQQGAPGGGQQGGEGGQRRMMMFGGGAGGPGGGPFGNMSDEQRQQMREALQKLTGGRNIQDIPQEERMQLFAKMREMMSGASKQGESKQGEAKQGESKQGEARRAEGQPRDESGRREMRFGFQAPGQTPPGEGGDRGGRGGRQGGPGGMPGAGGIGQFSAKDLENAKLPPPPGEDSPFEILLRPGLLADVEIIVEKVPNAVYVPNQSVFEKEGKPVVFVKSGEKFEPRQIQIAKRSETVTIVSGGIKPGDVIALADPTAKPGDSQKKAAGKSSTGPMGAMPGGAAKGGQ